MSVLEELTDLLQNYKFRNQKEILTQIAAVLEDQENRLQDQERRLLEQEKRLLVLEENTRNNNSFLEEHRAQHQSLEENIRRNNEFMETHLANHQHLEENVRNNNRYLEEQMANQQSVDDLRKEIRDVVKYTAGLKAAVKTEQTESASAEPPSSGRADSVENKNAYDGIDYFDFEDHFRGSREAIKNVQRQYLKYYKGKKNVLDVGCGRGEFLELLAENGIGAAGVDFYPEYVEYCKMRNLNVVCADAISYLEQTDSVDGIFAGQIVEHLTTAQVIRLCELAFEKLTENSYLVIETPNPTSLAIYSHAFYLDPSHEKPVHPLTLNYYLQKAGFQETEILYTENSKLPVTIPELKIEGVEDIELFNAAMKQVEETLFGSQDYAIIAQK